MGGRAVPGPRQREQLAPSERRIPSRAHRARRRAGPHARCTGAHARRAGAHAGPQELSGPQELAGPQGCVQGQAQHREQRDSMLPSRKVAGAARAGAGCPVAAGSHMPSPGWPSTGLRGCPGMPGAWGMDSQVQGMHPGRKGLGREEKRRGRNRRTEPGLPVPQRRQGLLECAPPPFQEPGMNLEASPRPLPAHLCDLISPELRPQALSCPGPSHWPFPPLEMLFPGLFLSPCPSVRSCVDWCVAPSPSRSLFDPAH